MDTASIYEQVTAAAGGAAQLARELGETSGAVCNWKVRGFPPYRCKAIEAITGISVKRLRPTDWMLYWPDLKRGASR